MELKKIENEIKKYDDPELTFHPKLSKKHYIYFGFFFLIILSF